MQMIEFAFSLLLFLSYPVHIFCIAAGISENSNILLSRAVVVGAAAGIMGLLLV